LREIQDQPRRGWQNTFMPPTQPLRLTPNEARVLGALIEKEITTPEYYPMSLNALINACNQRSNREPVMDLDEEMVRQALHGLEDDGLAGRARSADGRVTKYEHWLGEAFNFSRAETALICVLLLRGPQTPGELRGRAERMFKFEDLSDVTTTLQRLIEWDPPMIVMLARQAGTKESRYAHLLSGPVESAVASVPHDLRRPPEAPHRTGELEKQIAEMREEIDELKRQFAEFKKAFE
jgi:uncharacterized protein